MANLLLKNPRWMVLLIAVIVISGSVAYVLLPRQEDPRLTPRAARITTVLPGANAQRVEALVTEKLEDELSEIEEIKELTSNSSTNLSFVAIELRDDINADEANNVWTKVRDRMEAAHDQMPPETQASEFKRFDITANALVVGLRWVSQEEPNFAVLRRTLKRLQSQIDAIEGTESTQLYGDPEEEVLVTLDPEKMTAIHLNASEISNIIRASDSKTSAGLLRNRTTNTLLEVNGELDSLSRIAAIPIQEGSAATFVRLGEIADIQKTIRQPADSLVLLKDCPSIVLGAQLRPSSRIDQWTAKVDQTLAEFRQSLPEELAFEIVFEQNPYVQSRIHELIRNLAISAVSIFLVVLLMMGWRSALIVGVTLPLVSLMVLAAMHGLGIPIHQMSITGLIVALGLMIDNAIVVVDEVHKRLRQGRTALQAVTESNQFLFLPLLGATITTCLSFSPIILMGGPAGEFVGSIAVVTVVAVISSFGLAILLTTPMAGWFLSQAGAGWWSEGLSLPFVGRCFESGLRLAIQRPVIGIMLSLLPPLLGFVVALDLAEQFFPPADRNQFQIELEIAASGAIDETSELAKQVRNQLLQDKRIEEVDWFLGESAPIFYYNLIPVRSNAAQYGQAMVTCKPNIDMRALLLEKQAQLEKSFPEATILVRQLEQGPPFDAPVEIRIEGDDLRVLRALGEHLRLILTQTQQVHHTRSSLSEVLPKIAFTVDEEQARLANLDYQTIADRLNTALEGITGGSVMEGLEELPVRVRVSGEHRADLNKIASIEFLGQKASSSDRPSGYNYAAIPLSALSEMELESEYTSIARRNGQRINEVQAFIDAGVLPSKVLTEFRSRLKDSGFTLPVGYHLSFGGAEAERNEAVNALIGKGVIIGTLMVVALVISLGSFRFATVLFVVAGMSVGLGVGSLWLAGLPWGFMSIVAIMGMIGVAVNDSIVVLSALLELSRHETATCDRVVECVIENSRHILVTTLTTVIGFAPLFIGGSEFWSPVAIAMSGGVTGATVLALVFVPCLFVLVRRRK